MNLLPYTLEDLKYGFHHPSAAVREGQRILGKPLIPLNNWHFRRKHGRGIDVMQRDWDNLFILDACRYDYFVEENQIDGRLQSVVSQGNYSWEFMKSNFSNRKLTDTVYVTANPYAERLSADLFYTIESLLDEWDDDLGTVRPEKVSEAAREAHRKYPNKRLIVHFMQPHLPFIGDTASRVRERITLKGWDKYDHRDETRAADGIDWWTAVRRGLVTKAETDTAYRETLDFVLDHAESLIADFDGKSIVTADHGEMLGERIFPGLAPQYGHPKNIHTPELCVVPWLEVESDDRREVRSESPLGFETHENVTERLHALGYTSE